MINGQEYKIGDLNDLISKGLNNQNNTDGYVFRVDYIRTLKKGESNTFIGYPNAVVILKDNTCQVIYNVIIDVLEKFKYPDNIKNNSDLFEATLPNTDNVQRYGFLYSNTNYLLLSNELFEMKGAILLSGEEVVSKIISEKNLSLINNTI